MATYFKTENNNVNYIEIKNSEIKLNHLKIETIEQYVDWVKEWKTVHKVLVSEIIELRRVKNQFKKDGNGTGCNTAWNSKKMLGQFARRLYEARIENKTRLKAGEFKVLETAV